MRQPANFSNLWLCWPLSLLAFGIAKYDLGIEDAPPPKTTFTSLYECFVYTLPIAGFGLMVASEVAAWLFSRLGPTPAGAALRHPVMAVHLVSLLFYTSNPGIESSTMHDTFGRPLNPLRYVMWTISVSSMCLAIYLVCEGVMRRQREELDTLSSESKMRDMFINCLLGCYGTFTFGLLALIMKVGDGDSMAIAFCLSSACFYLMLWELTSLIWLVIKSKSIAGTAAATQFHVIRAAILTVWHLFPIVWLLGVMGILSPEEEYVGYMLGDMVAKYLLLFVYISSVTTGK